MNPKLESLKEVCKKEDWDSYGAEPITLASLEKADIMLNWLKAIGAKDPQPVPTVDGGVQLEWHSGGLYVELEIAPNGEDCSFHVFRDSKLILRSGGVE